LLAQELVVGVKFRLRHAIRTAKIALVEQRNAQIMQRPVERVPSLCTGSNRHWVWNQSRTHRAILP
jgi:hypothetical protein